MQHDCNQRRAAGLSMVLVAALLTGVSAWAVETVRDLTIPNQLGLTWPGDLVSFDVPAAGLPDGPLSLQVQGRTRPVQTEPLPGDKQVRLWSVVTIGDKDAEGRKLDISTVSAHLLRGSAEPGIQVSRQDGCFLVDNGVYLFRLRAYDGALPRPLALSALPHWIGGMRSNGQKTWDGRAWFEGRPRVTAATTEVVRQGPVFWDFRITIEFEQLPGDEDGTVPALPLACGKQTQLWPPNELPVEEVPKRTNHYEALVRFVAGDPWIDVNERFHFPRDPDSKPWGVSQYWLQWGTSEGAPRVPGFNAQDAMPVDTVTWVRWFLYDQFGGNIDQHYVPAKPRPDQKGRPFALLRPRWNQGGGGAQDFFLTAGGPPPTRQRQRIDGKWAWVEEPAGAGYSPDLPAAGVVAAYASKWVGPYANYIPAYALDGDRGRCRFPMIDGERSGRYYGQRAYGLCAGPRRLFRSINNVVRRHTDWTLTAQINSYILEWDRGAEVEESRGLPSAQLFIERRYQDDFLNPTQQATRKIKRLAEAKRQAGDKAVGGPWQAALGYIFSDLDHWPGWHNGFSPGNPNFHTDKYMAAVYVAAALPRHPHAKCWLAYGWSNFQEDLEKVLLEPDGVGVECPGYSGYSLSHQLDLVQTFRDNGFTGVLASIPMLRPSGIWHRKLITPPDFRIQRRHEAPHGDTHRWDSGLASGFGKLAYLYQKADPAFAAEMLGTLRLLKASGASAKVMSLDSWLGGKTLSVTPQPAAAMDWSSQAFSGFGAVMRSGFGTDQETFLSLKAGRARGHYHNDELAFHYYADNTPISLDYNCSYHPRGDHAGLHNSMTFGKTGALEHNGKGYRFQAMEEIGGTATVLAFTGADVADAVVAERRADSVVMRPVDPRDSEFNRGYPTRKTAPVVHRRTLALIKHPPTSVLTDYLVVLDDTRGTEPQQINLHLLARHVDIEDSGAQAVGQWDKDMLVRFFPLSPDADLRLEKRSWYYYDEWMLGPGDAYTLRPDESLDAWAARMKQLPRVPAADWEPRWKDGRDDPAAKPWHALIEETDGQALIPPPGWDPSKGWMYGEYQKWLRVHTAPGSAVLWVLYPYPRGTARPAVSALPGNTGVRITCGDETEDVRLRPGAPLVVVRGGQANEIIRATDLPPMP